MASAWGYSWGSAWGNSWGTIASVVSGVKAKRQKTIRLSDLRELDRESTAEFIKSHLKRQYDDVALTVTTKGDSNVRKKQAQANASEEHAEKTRQAQILRAKLNRNAILAIILASEV